MTSTTLFVNYRPLKIGFCVRQDNIEDLVRAGELNTLLWGGAYNPIIPIGENNQFAKQLVKVFEPDLLYSVSDAPEIKEFVKTNDHIMWREYYGELLYERLEKETRMRVLDVSNIVNYYWEKEFKNTKQSNCILPIWSKTDSLATMLTLQFGNYPTEPKLSFNHRVGFLRGMRAKTHRIVKGREVDPKLHGMVTPISMTEDRLRLGGGRHGWDSVGVYAGDPDNNQDLINFWNLRASGIDLCFIPLGEVSRVKEFAKKHIAIIEKRDSAQRFPRGIGFWYRNEVGDDAIRALSEQLVTEGKSRSFCGVSDHLWNGLNLYPPKPKFEHQSILAGIDWSNENPSVSFQLPPKPVEANRRNGRQQLVIEFSPNGEHGYKGSSLKLPFFPDMNEWYARNAIVDPFGLRVGHDEVGIIVDMDDSTERIYPIKIPDIIRQIFIRAGIQAKSSKPGLIAQRLVERMGGDLDDCRVFKIRGVRNLISSLDPTEFITYSTAIQVIRDVDDKGKPSFDNHKSLHIQSRDTPNLTPQEVFDYLLEKNVFTAGLAPTCPNCELEFWLSLQDANEEIKCEYCGHQFKIATQLRDRGDFRFRRSGLFGRADNQEGSVPVILTLLQMLRLNGMSEFLYCTGTELNSKALNINCETDFIILGRDNWKDKVTVVIGESKTNSTITDSDVQNMVHVKKELDKSGVETYILFSKTTDFTVEELERFKPLAVVGQPPILLTQRELEPYDPYDYYHDAKINLPHIYTHQFSEMAQNSYEIYLKKKMKNALILHGTDGHSKENWFDWLKVQLEMKGWETWVPDLPGANKPNIERYNEFIFANKDWQFNKDSIVIGHSSGAVAILGLLQALPEDIRIDTCYLIGAFRNDLKWDALSDLFLKPFDFEKIKTKARRFVFIHSDNDPYCPLDHAQFLSEKLGGELIVKPGQKHFSVGTMGESYKQFPELLSLIEAK